MDIKFSHWLFFLKHLKKCYCIVFLREILLPRNLKTRIVYSHIRSIMCCCIFMGFTYCNVFSSRHNLMTWKLLWSVLCKWGNWAAEELNILFNVKASASVWQILDSKQVAPDQEIKHCSLFTVTWRVLLWCFSFLDDLPFLVRKFRMVHLSLLLLNFPVSVHSDLFVTSLARFGFSWSEFMFVCMWG